LKASEEISTHNLPSNPNKLNKMKSTPISINDDISVNSLDSKTTEATPSVQSINIRSRPDLFQSFPKDTEILKGESFSADENDNEKPNILEIHNRTIDQIQAIQILLSFIEFLDNGKCFFLRFCFRDSILIL
jgi:hypothetical protein